MSSADSLRAGPLEAAMGSPPHARVLLIGASDTGKTTLAATIVCSLVESGRVPVAVVDGDIGQSEIGSRGVVGLGVASEVVPSLSRIPQVAGAFVGAVTPHGCALETGAAIIQMAQAAAVMRPRPECTVIDTPGYISGEGGAMLRMLIDVIRPHLVIALERDGELEAILRPLESGQQTTRIMRAPPSPRVGRKSGTVRGTRRAARFGQHLAGAKPMELAWDPAALAANAHRVVLERTPLSYGAPLQPHEATFVGRTLRLPCLYAEQSDDGRLFAVIRPVRPDTRLMLTDDVSVALKQSLNVRQIVLQPLSRYDGLLCGVLSPPGDLLGIGLLAGLDFTRRSLALLTPVRSAGAIGRLVFGEERLRPDGRELDWE